MQPERRTIWGISSGTLAEKIAALGTDTHYFPSFDAIETFLLENCVNGDLLITMGGRRYCKSGRKAPWTVSYPHYPQSFQQNPVEYPVDFFDLHNCKFENAGK